MTIPSLISLALCFSRAYSVVASAHSLRFFCLRSDNIAWALAAASPLHTMCGVLTENWTSWFLSPSFFSLFILKLTFRVFCFWWDSGCDFFHSKVRVLPEGLHLAASFSKMDLHRSAWWTLIALSLTACAAGKNDYKVLKNRCLYRSSYRFLHPCWLCVQVNLKVTN